MEEQQYFALGRIIIFGHRVDTLKVFYSEHFKFSVLEEIKGQWIVLSDGNIEMAIHKIGKDFEPGKGEVFKAKGNVKLVLQTTADIHNIRARLLEDGVSVGEVKSFSGISALFCDGEDPEGNVFQIEQRLE